MSLGKDWSSLLAGHPIFTLPKPLNGSLEQSTSSLELSTRSLPNFTNGDTSDASIPSGRRQVMALKDADLIVAAGNEVRISALGDAKLSQSTRQTYK
ncbi:hypothetical protein H0H93_013567, partial [Arthromyces matolae]